MTLIQEVGEQGHVMDSSLDELIGLQKQSFMEVKQPCSDNEPHRCFFLQKMNALNSCFHTCLSVWSPIRVCEIYGLVHNEPKSTVRNSLSVHHLVINEDL